jgi:hypothetical protein
MHTNRTRSQFVAPPGIEEHLDDGRISVGLRSVTARHAEKPAERTSATSPTESSDACGKTRHDDDENHP